MDKRSMINNQKKMKTKKIKSSSKYRTYAETKGKKRFDWLNALSTPCTKLNVYEVKSMNKRAKSWLTDACGNQCSIIPRHVDGRPIDSEMLTLGADFNSHVEQICKNLLTIKYVPVSDTEKETMLSHANISRSTALKILKKIERRGTKLMREVIITQKMLKRP
jgi:hypothetical protein